jgi:methylmalonyl-CoA mutase C-terminal domain/subunit
VNPRRPPRVLVAKPGLDGHDRGAKVVAFALRDAGCEVIYLGLRCTAERIIEASVQEDVDVIGVSVLSGAHLPLTAQLVEARARRGLDDVPIVVGGTVPPGDVERLLALGVTAVFPAGSDIGDVVDAVVALARRDPADRSRGTSER